MPRRSRSLPWPIRRVAVRHAVVALSLLVGCGRDPSAATEEARQREGATPHLSSAPLEAYFPLSPGDRWRTLDAPSGTIAQHGVTAIDARGQAVVYGTDRAAIELFRRSATRVERVSPDGASLGLVLVSPLERGKTFRYEGGEGARRPSCEGRVVRDDATFELDGLPLDRCVVVERTCHHEATPPLPSGTRERHEEIYCPGVGLVRDRLRFDPPLPVGSPLGEHTTTTIGFRTRGGPVPPATGGLDCDDLIVLPTDLAAACGGGPFRALELSPDRPGTDCTSLYATPTSSSAIRIRARRLDHEATAADVESLAHSASVAGRQALIEGNVAVLLEAEPDVCASERLARLVPLVRSLVR